MALRGSYKWFSRRGEDRLARAYGGRVDPSSGAGIRTKGDVKQARETRLVLEDQVFESKHRGTYEKPAKSCSLSLRDFEKLADIAYSESREPVFHIALCNPDSPLANDDGEIDFVIRLLPDDVRREQQISN